MQKKRALIIGAGPAGLTAAYELLEKTDIEPFVFEMTDEIGGISKTVNYKGNRIDIGGHRFFSKSDRVMMWWMNIMPLQGSPAVDDIILNRKKRYSDEKNAPDPERVDNVMLLRNRLSRVFFLRKFFNYPISLSIRTFLNLGFMRTLKIGFSYIYTKLFPIKNEKTLEDFFINRFGKELYKTFFKDYTEKVWGISCCKIKPDWGAQRIKGLSITKAVLNAVKTIFIKDKSIDQKNKETSLIDQYLYPKFGPGQLWELVNEKIKSRGGKVFLEHEVVGIDISGEKVVSIKVKDSNGHIKTYKGDYFFSSMPVKDLISAFTTSVPERVYKVSQGLMYRDFITVGLLLRELKIKNHTKIKTVNNIVPDTWIYIQERDVRMGRLQIFNNWSPYMVKDKDTVWIGLEYFCNTGDELWSMSDEEFSEFAITELDKIDIIEKDKVLDSVVIRMPKTYPAYFGTYDEFHVVKNYTDKFENLFLVGRNGMHKYNNADHSMLTAMEAVDNILKGLTSKDNIWNVNTEKEYHEEK